MSLSSAGAGCFLLRVQAMRSPRMYSGWTGGRTSMGEAALIARWRASMCGGKICMILLLFWRLWVESTDQRANADLMVLRADATAALVCRTAVRAILSAVERAMERTMGLAS